MSLKICWKSNPVCQKGKKAVIMASFQINAQLLIVLEYSETQRF